MSTQPGQEQTYTIKETASLTGLAESNLRYYETIGLIPPIARDPSSKYRVYKESDVDYIVSISCLSGTGMSIGDMQKYLRNANRGGDTANEQVLLLDKQNSKLKNEEKLLKLRRQYLTIKADYWRAVGTKDLVLANDISKKATELSKLVKEIERNA